MDDFELDGSTDTALSLKLNATDWKRYTGASNSKGFSKQVWVSLTPEEVGRIAGLVKQAPEYRSVNDIIRNYIRWGMRIDSVLMKDTNPVKSYEAEIAYRRMSRQLAFDHEDALIEQDEHYSQRAMKMMERRPSVLRVKLIRELIEDMVDDSIRYNLSEALKKWAGEFDV